MESVFDGMSQRRPALLVEAPGLGDEFCVAVVERIAEDPPRVRREHKTKRPRLM